MAGTRSPRSLRTPRTSSQAASGRFSRTQRPASSPARRGVASGRRFGRSTPQPKPNALNRVVGSVVGAKAGKRSARAASKVGAGKPAGLALLAAAGVAFAKRDKLSGMLRRNESSDDLSATTPTSTVTAGTVTPSVPGTATTPSPGTGSAP